jgi:hypothetical protein
MHEREMLLEVLKMQARGRQTNEKLHVPEQFIIVALCGQCEGLVTNDADTSSTKSEEVCEIWLLWSLVLKPGYLFALHYPEELDNTPSG